jgi:polar amino acid transport system substrate-binding protein
VSGVTNRRRLIVLICGLLLLLAGCGQEEDTWARIEASGVLRVGVDPTFPPFALAEGTDVRGIDIDLARALAEALGLEAQFTYFGYDGLYDALTTGQVDALISALVVVPDRMADVAYTGSYYDAGQFLVAPAGSDLTGMADLDGRVLAVELGALGHVEALAWQRRLPGLVVGTHGSVDEALAAVAAGQADAALVDSVTGRLYLRDHPTPPLVLLPEPVTPEPYVIAVRIGDRTLHRELDAALTRSNESGELEQIIARWLD